jgi:hypothetical protein
VNDRAGAWLDGGLRYRLWFSEEDEHDGPSLPFSLCRRGDVVAARNVSCGAIDGREVRLFDLDVLVRDDGSGTPSGPDRLVAALLDESFVDDREAGHRVSERWECAMVRADAECWRLSVGPEGLLTMLADGVTLRDHDTELDAFNRMFEVRADDRKFANDFLDARMIRFLVEHAASCVLETVGNRILVARPAGAVPDVDALIAFAMGVAERVPNAVKSLHPALPAPELTPRCPVGPDGVVRELGASDVRADRFDPWPDVPSGWA